MPAFRRSSVSIAMFVAIAGAMFGACGQENSPKGVADRFLYLYLIEINQQKAKALTEGLAASKLDDEINSLRSIRSMDIDLAEHRPFIDYKLVQKKPRGENRMMLVYDVKIKPRNEELGERKQSLLVSTVRESGRWMVDNFENYESDEP
jgi:hypothetical protein